MSLADGKDVEIVMYPEALIALGKETAYHPKLMKLINALPKEAQGIGEQLVTVAIYCGIHVEGDFDITEGEFKKFCDKLHTELRKRREVIIQ